MSEGRFRRAYIGIAGGSRPLPPRLANELGRDTAIEVVETVEDSPAYRAGLRAEDLILEVDGKAVDGVDDLQRLMVGDLIGRTIEVTVHRSGRSFTAELTPVELDV
jgi:S1-C subfamily serine protease